jgi:biopolymer transport protein ExbB/TolQ
VVADIAVAGRLIGPVFASLFGEARNGGMRRMFSFRRQPEGSMDEPQKLRELAAWYREFAERTGNPDIWEARLRMAEDLEAEADLLERRLGALAAAE